MTTVGCVLGVADADPGTRGDFLLRSFSTVASIPQRQSINILTQRRGDADYVLSTTRLPCHCQQSS